MEQEPKDLGENKKVVLRILFSTENFWGEVIAAVSILYLAFRIDRKIQKNLKGVLIESSSKIMGFVGFDFVIIDEEHGLYLSKILKT